MTDFAYDGPIFLVPLSPSYPSSPVFGNFFKLLIFVAPFIVDLSIFSHDLMKKLRYSKFYSFSELIILFCCLFNGPRQFVTWK